MAPGCRRCRPVRAVADGMNNPAAMLPNRWRARRQGLCEADRGACAGRLPVALTALSSGAQAQAQARQQATDCFSPAAVTGVRMPDAWHAVGGRCSDSIGSHAASDAISQQDIVRASPRLRHRLGGFATALLGKGVVPIADLTGAMRMPNRAPAMFSSRSCCRARWPEASTRSLLRRRTRGHDR